MSDERHARVTALFLQAFDLPPGEREAWLDRACAEDPDLRGEVAALLAFEAETPDFLERPRSNPRKGWWQAGSRRGLRPPDPLS